MRSEPPSRYTAREEIANSITHGVGIVLSIAGLGVLTAFAALRGDAWHIVSCSIFGATLVILYAASTLYHAIPNRRAKAALRLLDHSAIFLLIAGTYTPFALVSLRGPWGWSLFGVVWSTAILGIVMRATMPKRSRATSVALYLALGWTAVVAVRPLTEAIAPGGLVLLFTGGAAYSLGVLFYAWRGLPFGHAIWHGFVLAGSILHYFAVLLFIIPGPPASLS